MTDNTEKSNTSNPPTTDEPPQEFFKSIGDTINDIKSTGAEDAEGHPVQEIESLCMNCHKTGTTRMLLTSIPYFREIVIMSFHCPHCGFDNSDVQAASQIQEKGGKYTFRIETPKDLTRQIIKSEHCTCKFVELDIEIPAQRGQISSVEGILNQVKDDLESNQPARKAADENLYNQIQEVIEKIKKAIAGQTLPLTLIIDDPSGNSWIEFVPGEASHKWSHVEYFRSNEQNATLGLAAMPGDDKPQTSNSDSVNFPMDFNSMNDYVPMGTTAKKNSDNASATRNKSEASALNTQPEDDIYGEVHTFEAPCPVCHYIAPTHMKVVNIPHFKDVIIMSLSCSKCGYKSNEIKTGGAIPAQGRRISLKVTDPDDLSRDILKSETAGLTIPELHLDLTPGTLGGRFTTLEGLLRQVHDELESKVFTETSDSMEPETKNNWKKFLDRMQEAIDGKIEFTVNIEDPLAGSYIQNPFAPDPDPNMTIEDYDRTFEQNEDLGLNDINVGNTEEKDESKDDKENK